MPSTSAASESGAVEAIRSRLKPPLKPLFDESNQCLPILQTTCHQIMNVMGPDCSAASLAQIISRDHGLTCRVLRVANSIAYSPQQTIVSVVHAVSWLGLDTVRSLVAAAHLVEQLQHWPERHKLIRTVIARSLLAATHAGELGAALEHPQPSHLFTSAMLYSIGDLAIAYQDWTLYRALQDVSKKTRNADERRTEEVRLIGISRSTFAQALARLWNLPESLVDLFGHAQKLPRGRWENVHQTYQGIVIGSIRVVEGLAGGGSPGAVEDAKRLLLIGSGLPSGRFSDLMISAMDRGRQLIRSMGLAIDPSDEGMLPLIDHDGDGLPSSYKVPARPAPMSQPSPLPQRADTGPTPLQARPFETLQAFQDALQQAKDLNALLIDFAQALHRDAGFHRVGLALLNTNDSDLLVGRLVLGLPAPSLYLNALSGSLSREHRFFLDVLKRLDPLLVTQLTKEEIAGMKPQFLDIWRPGSAILFPLRIGPRPMGLIYCDRGVSSPPLSAQDYQSCQLFFTSVTLGMNRMAGVL